MKAPSAPFFSARCGSIFSFSLQTIPSLAISLQERIALRLCPPNFLIETPFFSRQRAMADEEVGLPKSEKEKSGRMRMGG